MKTFLIFSLSTLAPVIQAQTLYRCEGRCVRTFDSVSPKTGESRSIYEEMGCGKIHRDGNSPQEALANLKAECTKRSGNRLLHSFTSMDATHQLVSLSDLEPGTHLIARNSAKDATVNDCYSIGNSGGAGGGTDADSAQ
jgi:hypothetical protein